jgi:hypothetical protein
MSTCPSCTRELDDGLLYLDVHEQPLRDQSKAAWKSCPRCSKVAVVHVLLPMSEFGSPVRQRRTPQNPAGLQSDCTFHRNNDNRSVPRAGGSRRTCGGTSVRPAARQPVVRPGTNSGTGPGDGQPEIPLSPEQLDALAAALTGQDKWSEEGRKFVRTHVATERSPANRRQILRLRAAQGPLTCDACGIALGEEYRPEHAQVVELHHVVPLAHGVQKPKGTDAFKLLCPTCHRVVHYRSVGRSR